MRKLWFMAVAALIVIAVAAPSFAAETTFSGSYRIRGVMDYNWEKRDLATDNTDPLYTGYFDQRFRLTITHKRSEFLKAVVSIDLGEDTWGQNRAFRINNFPGERGFGTINTAYIEAITPIGMIKVGTDGTSRYAYGLWSDSGIKGNGDNNASITYAAKVNNFIATVTYTKYVDFVQHVFDNQLGAPEGWFRTWPGTSFGSGDIYTAGGPGSKYYNADTDTYTITAHYIGDKFKVGGLAQWILDPYVVSASFLIPGIADSFAFAGETEGLVGLGPTFPLAGVPVAPAWPLPLDPATLAPLNPVSIGFGRAGMYSGNIFILGLYGDIKLVNDKLDIKWEFDRIFGTAHRNTLGDAYNLFLDRCRTPGTPIFHFPGFTHGGATLTPGQVLPEEIGIDGITAYLDVSYDFDVAMIGLAALYGGGEEHWRPFTQTHYNFNTTGNDDFHWGNIIVNGDWQFLNSSAPFGLSNNPENITSVKLYWSVNPMEKLDIHGAFIWAKYTVPVGRYARGGTGAYVNNWNAFYGHPMNYIDPTGTPVIPANVSDQLGWEIDLGLTYEIMEGLSLNSEFGILFTGSAFDYREPVTFTRESWGPIYRWANTLTYEF